MKRESCFIRILVIALLLLCFVSITITAANNKEGYLNNNASEEDNYAIFFYSLTCRGCEQVRPLVEAFSEEYPMIHLQYYEIHYNRTNLELFQDTIERRQIGSYYVPLFIIGTMTMSGEEEIRLGLQPYLRHERDLLSDIREPGITPVPRTPKTPSGTNTPGNLTAPDNSSPDRMKVTIASVLVAAAVDSINPCAFAVLFVLLAYLTSLHDRRRLLLVGIIYIGTVFAVYLVAGLAILRSVHTLGISGQVFTLAALVVIGAGFIQIMDLLLKQNGFTLSIPEAAKEKISHYIRRATIPSAVGLGALVSLVELPCTGGIYLAILGLISDRMTFAEGLPYLILYNVIFVLPLLIALFIVYYGRAPGYMETWRTRYNRLIRLLMGIFMLGIGSAMLFGVL
ncbi:MAG: cytochrome c biogenesis CcdA family protein [Methanocalculus sp.]|uniref:cytochrome c biogenesis CcdA family protein n=1 Tax=Methanocalculus sp. TaxID=2004547 RepID=UPI0027244B9B|nr:cytochrome c biogenesis CcdA family protein [Methanocalculus sp.]MDO9540275.1 cytochrome c biogenesis CcdA family protein [Methanocalculus sp.]